MKKIGLLCLALVFALGALGIGYAAWTDTLTVEGTVNTGDVDINVVGYSGTFVYKDPGGGQLPDGNETIVLHEMFHPGTPVEAPDPPTADGFLVGSAYAKMHADDVVEVVFDDIFPCVEFTADFILHYEGSIPAKFNFAWIDGSDWLKDLWDAGDAWAEAHWWNVPQGLCPICDGTLGEPVIDEGDGIQLHYCDHILVELTIKLPQDETLMNKQGGFSAMLQVVQWNKWPHAFVPEIIIHP